MRRVPAALAASILTCALVAAPTVACGGLIGPNGAVNLLRTTTFVGYHDGRRALRDGLRVRRRRRRLRLHHSPARHPEQRREGRRLDPPATHPRDRTAAARARCSRPTMLAARQPAASRSCWRRTIDALDITVLKGGGDEVGAWAADHGFRLPPDAPEVLDFYAQRSPIFLAASFDADAAGERGQAIGDGTPVHITIPTPTPGCRCASCPWARRPDDRVDADVYLLTDRAPDPAAGRHGRRAGADHTAPASASLLDDLRSDRGMEWVPERAWLMKVRVDVAGRRPALRPGGRCHGPRAWPSRVAAGLDQPGTTPAPADRPQGSLWLLRPGLAVAGQRRRGRGAVAPRPRAPRPGRLSRPSETRADCDAPDPWPARCPSRVALVVLVACRRRCPSAATVTIGIHYSHFTPAAVTRAGGRARSPSCFATTTPSTTSGSWATRRPTAVTARAPSHTTASAPPSSRSRRSRRVRTTVTFATPGHYRYICHLPGHEAYGMVGVVTVTGG